MVELIKNQLSCSLTDKEPVILQVKFWPWELWQYQNQFFDDLWEPWLSKCKNGPDYLQGLFQLPEPAITNHKYCKWHLLNVSEPVYYNSCGAFTLDVKLVLNDNLGGTQC
jgi:hypothetical protein